jgi:molybdate transport system substrate-binding protein
MRSKVLVFLLLFAGLAPSAATAAPKLLIAVASNFLIPVRAIAQEFEKDTGTKVRISSGSTGKLYAQIIHGARYDIFLAANSREPQRLEKAGLIVDGSRFTYARGKLVLWSLDPKLLATNPEQVVRKGSFKSIVFANPATAPYGEAGVEVLAKLKSNTGKTQVLTAENVTQSFQYIASSNAQLGFIAYSQLLASGKDKTGSHWLVAQKYYKPIEQLGVWLKSAAVTAAAGKFLEFLRSKRGQELVQQYGYGPGK